MTTRDDAIAYLVEKLREIEATENALYANHARATKNIGSMTHQAFFDHRENAALHYDVAYRCEQLIEEIAGNLLFDELDAQDAAADQAAKDAEADVDAWSTAEQLGRQIDAAVESTGHLPGHDALGGAWEDPAVRRAVREETQDGDEF